VRKIIVLGLMLLLAGQTKAQDGEQVESGQVVVAGQTHSYRIRRLPLSSFPELPASVSSALAQRGCTVPQTWEAKRPENVIHGAFYQAGHQDWAILCSLHGESSLFVFRDGMGVPLELMSYRDKDRLASVNETGQFGYAWAIDPAPPSRFKQFAPGQHFDHEGIEDSLIENSSTLRYFRDGQWISIQGLGS
jgi:hypothetical protein